MTNSYCLTCKKKTLDLKPIINRNQIKSICDNCGKNKSQFKKKQTGKGIVNDALKKIGDSGIEYHLYDEGNDGNFRRMSFCGPGTKLRKRLDKNDKPHAFSHPINALDWGCYRHDLAYRDHKDIATRNYHDTKLSTAASSVLSNPKAPLRQKITAKAVQLAMNTKSKLQF